jgi:hypothetical protein
VIEKGMAKEAQRSLKQIEQSIEESHRLLKKLCLRVEDLEAQIQTDQKTVESSKIIRRRKS